MVIAAFAGGSWWQPSAEAADLGAWVELLRTGDEDQRAEAAVKIGRLGHEGAAAVGDLADALQDPELRVRANAAWALSRIGPAGQAAIPQLLNALEDKSTDVSGRAIVALGSLGSHASECAPALMALLEMEERGRMRAALAAAVWQITGESEFALPILLELLAGPDSSSRANAASALDRVGAAAAQAVPALEAALADEDEKVRAAVAKAVESITGSEGPEPGGGDAVDGSADPDRPAHWPKPPDGPWTRETAVAAIVQIASQGLSLGVVDDTGAQLNLGVPAGAISLTPDDVAAHADLLAGGNYRTIAHVVEYAAAAGVRLAATGRPITVEDLLPDLQTCVNEAVARPDRAGSTMGLLLASGTNLAPPDTPPQMSADTHISPLAALMMLADLLIGIEPGRLGAAPSAVSGRWASASPAPRVGVPRLIWAAVGDDAARALKRIRGAITMIEADPKGHPVAAGGLAIYGRQVKQILRLFEASNRLAVRVKFGPGQQDILRTIRFRNRKGKVQIGVGTQWRDADTAALSAEVMLVAGTTEPQPIPKALFEYTIDLYSPDDPFASGKPLYDDAQARLVRGSAGVLRHDHRFVGRGRQALFGLQATKVENQEYRMALLVVQARIPADKEARLSDKLAKYLGQAQSILGLKLTEDEEKALRSVGLEKALNLSPWMCQVIFETTGMPDLTIVKAKVSEISGDATITIFNKGPGNLGGQRVTIQAVRVVDDPNEPNKSTTVDRSLSLAVDAAQEVSIPCGSLLGVSEIQFTVDARDAVTEADEKNNVFTYSVAGDEKEYTFTFDEADCDRFRACMSRDLLAKGDELRDPYSDIDDHGTYTEHQAQARDYPYPGRVHLTYWMRMVDTYEDLGGGRRGAGAAVYIEKYPTDKMARGRFAQKEFPIAIWPIDFRPETVDRRRKEMAKARLGGSIDVTHDKVTIWDPSFTSRGIQSQGKVEVKLVLEVFRHYKNCIIGAGAVIYVQIPAGSKPKRAAGLPADLDDLITRAMALIDAKRAADPGVGAGK